MLPETPQLLIFIGASVALLVTPGPAVLYVVARSAEQGRLAGLFSAFGLVAGGVVHVAAAALGLSAILVSSAALYSAVKLAGAAYLIYLGIQTLRGANSATQAERPAPRSLRRLFRDGFIVNLLNPKAALFFFAFLPQFTDPLRGLVAAQVLALGGIFLLLALLSDTIYALVAGSLAEWFQARPGRIRAQRWASGLIYLGLGAATALGSRSK